ncbi:collagen binding domain-containing protein [Actinoplanes sp. NPDC051343]|uniref:collagen binding domain-containing protein n=1 Tax=Actinoplanes sp. NPDC051343 TaxID=3363906 RepID=UPI0037882D87
MGTSRWGRAFAVMAAGLVAGAMLPGAAHADDPATGSITGRFTQAGGGKVTVNLWTVAGGSAGQVTSDAEGDYTFASVAPGQYKVQFVLPNFGSTLHSQWAYQKLTYSTASVVAVTGGAATEVDDSLISPTGVQLTVTDADTGAPVDDVCVSQYQGGFGGVCGGTNGVFSLPNVQDGAQTLYLTSPDGLHASTTVGVTVKFGVLAKVAVSVKATAAITTKVVDSATGDPVPDVCVIALPTVFGTVDGTMCQYGSPNYSAQDGTATIGALAAGSYELLALPEDGIHGIQWVGAKGGTGSQYKAKRLDLIAGRSTAAPVVKLDPAASITGTITDADTGETLINGCASVLPVRPGQGTTVVDPSCASYYSPTYTIANLGPYAWPVRFSSYYDSDNYGGIWSGNAADRKAATPIQAGATQPTVADAQLHLLGTGLKLAPKTSDGMPYSGYLNVDVFNARTGDYVKSVSYQTTLDGVIDQPVRLQYYAGSAFVNGWYGGTNFATATNVRVNPAAPPTVKIALQDN